MYNNFNKIIVIIFRKLSSYQPIITNDDRVTKISEAITVQITI